MNWEDRLLRSDVRTMDSYTPIVPFEVLSARLGRAPEDIVKLDANENPYGPSPRVNEALAGGRYYHVYPDPEAGELRRALSEYVSVPADRLLAGMGADELIDLVLRAVITPGDAIIDCPPSFGMYPFSTAVNGGRTIAVPRRADFSLDVVRVVHAASATPEAKVLFLCSPNNPDGGVISEGDLRRLLALPLLVVLDEAYVDFAMMSGVPSRMAWVMDFDNLVVLRTFSKLAGLAGLRLGYGAFPAWLLAHLWKIKQPYNVNVAASLAGLTSLTDEAWLRDKLALIVAERERMVARLAEFDFLHPYPSQANFVLFRVEGRSAGSLKTALEQEGVLVRYFQKPGVDNCIRISVGKPADTDRLVAALWAIERGRHLDEI